MMKENSYFCVLTMALSLLLGCMNNANPRNEENINNPFNKKNNDSYNNVKTPGSGKQVVLSSAENRFGFNATDILGIEFNNDLLKVSVENQKFINVMEVVAQKTGIKIVIFDPIDEDVTIDFDYLPLKKGLQRLLRDRNYVLVYRLDKYSQITKVMKVFVFLEGEDTLLFEKDNFQNPFTAEVDIFEEMAGKEQGELYLGEDNLQNPFIVE